MPGASTRQLWLLGRYDTAREERIYSMDLFHVSHTGIIVELDWLVSQALLIVFSCVSGARPLEISVV